jgi:iron complex transport system substrate-binding protein
MNKVSLSALICIIIIAVSAIVVAFYYNPSPASNLTQSTQKVTDMTGRTVTVPSEVNRVIGLNYGALRLITYMEASQLVCGVEQIETDLAGRPYAMAHPEYTTLPVIGPQFGGDPELIATQNPDVVFITDTTRTDLDSLQSQLKIPVIGLIYGGLDNAETRQTFYDSLTLIGKVLNNENRATQVINYVNNIINDLNDRTNNIANIDKPSVYVGGLSMRGNHGFTSTSANYAPFTLTNSKNVITLEMTNNSTQVVNIDVEALPNLNPDIVFIDYNGLILCQQDIQTHKDVYNQLDAIKNNQTYGVMGYNWYALNFDVVLTDAYYIGTILYPTQFADIDPAQKANEIYTFLCGAPLYSQMVELYGPFEPIIID